MTNVLALCYNDFGKKSKRGILMAKLYFRHGSMGSSKTANALMVDYNGSIIFFVGLPPRNVLICYATLDRMEKQCCSFITDGEELKNNLLFLRQAT